MKVNSHRRRRPGEPDRGRKASVFRVRDWRVPTKLAAVLVLPAVAFLVIAGVQINSSVRSATTLDQFAEGIKVGRQLTDLVHQLQLERDRTAGVLARAAMGGPGDPASINAELAADYAATDTALAAFNKAAGPLRENSIFGNASPAITTDFRELQLVREGVKNRWLRQTAVFDHYTSTIAHLFDLVPESTEVGRDAQTARNMSSLLDLAEIKELTDQLRGRIFAACSAGRFSPEDFETFAEIQARQVSAVQRFRSQASPQHLQRYDDGLRAPAVAQVSRLQQQVIGRARGVAVGTTAEEWWRSSTNELELIRVVEQDMLEDIIEDAIDRSSAERRNAFLATSVIVLIMLMALLLSWMIGRSMARSLRQLRAQALDVAQHRLPEAIERLRTAPRGETITVDTSTKVQSSDEIGEVAEAFTAVHRSAVSLAVEQAVMRRNVNSMFVNLARRSQTLVERQLQLLDQLEAAEADPDQLANLFRLDHLATRMRRNDENLLVLAGSEASRRWVQPVSLSAVTMAAMAEIEQYARIRHDVANDVFVVGHAVADIVHLLAELLENATTFSPPDTVVTVTGWSASYGNEATIVIEDRGLGMTESGLYEANERVSSPVAIDVAASERMGLVVVGHLAARHRVHVRLTGSDEGVVAYVTLPNRLLAPPPDGGGLYGGATGRLAGVTRLPIEAGPQGTGTEQASAVSQDSGPVPADSPTAVLPSSMGRPEGLGEQTVPLPPRIPNQVPAVAAPPLPDVAAGGPQPDAAGDATRTQPAATGDEPVEPGPAAPPGEQTIVADEPVSATPAASTTPTANAPVSGIPVSAVPVSGAPVSSAPVSGADDEMVLGAADASSTPPNGKPGGGNGRQAPTQRRGPGRAEDIIGAASGGAAAPAKGTRWWSRGGGRAAGNRPSSVIPAQREPVIAGMSNVGLPMRVPMAQLPGDRAETASVTPVAPIHTEPDPASVSSMLSRFYSGVHRAANEDELPTVPISDHRGARRDSEPTST